MSLCQREGRLGEPRADQEERQVEELKEDQEAVNRKEKVVRENSIMKGRDNVSLILEFCV